jgi:hypothetical protein
MRDTLPRLARADGQASVEHIGLVALLALALGALATVDAPPAPAQAVVRSICAAVGGECGEPAAGRAGPTSPAASELEIVDRYIEADLGDFLAYRASSDRDRRLDWSTDECSAPIVGSTGASFDFTDACLRHDFGYRNYRRLGLFEERKPLVDDRFLSDMRAHCATRAADELDRCDAWARTFYLAVRHLGHLAGRRQGAE